MKRIIVTQTAAVALLSLAAACGGSAENVSSDDATPSGQRPSSDSAEVKTIGVSNLGLSFPFPASISKGIKQAAEEKGVEIVELDAQAKADKQTADVQDLVNRKPDGVLLLPVDSGIATSMADMLEQAGIPTVAVASAVGDKNRKPEDVYPSLVALVTQAEVEAGAKAGEIALQKLPEGGKMAVVEGAAGFAEVQSRFADFLKPAEAAGVKFDVVARQPGDWVPDKAQAACENMLASQPDIALFYAQSDDMAVGCAKAVKAAGKQAIVVGIGGSKLGIDAIKAGEIQGTVCYKPVDMGVLAFNTLYESLTGEKPLSAEFVTYETPAITEENVADCTPQW